MGQDAARSADDLVNAIKRPFTTARDLLNKIPDRKQQYTDMQAKRVEYANKTFRDAASKPPAKKRDAKRKKTRPGIR